MGNTPKDVEVEIRKFSNWLEIAGTRYLKQTKRMIEDVPDDLKSLVNKVERHVENFAGGLLKDIQREQPLAAEFMRRGKKLLKEIEHQTLGSSKKSNPLSSLQKSLSSAIKSVTEALKGLFLAAKHALYTPQRAAKKNDTPVLPKNNRTVRNLPRHIRSN